jgi:urease accessory protein
MAATASAERERIFAGNRAVGMIDLSVVADAGITRRKIVHEAGPLRVRFPNARELEAVIVNTGGGIAGGDRLDLRFAVGPAARLKVTSAAAEKVYRSHGPDATVAVRLEVGPGGALAWLPQETILFDRARLWRRIDVELAADARLILVEAVILGRQQMGEAMTDGRLLDSWRVRRSGQLIFAEGLRLAGAIAEDLAASAAGNGASALATVLIAPGTEATADAVRSLEPQLAGEVGVSAWNGLALVRFCARDGATLRHDLVVVLSAVHGPLPRLWVN